MHAQQTIKPNPQKMRRQAYALGFVALIGAFIGAYLVAAGALPNQYNLHAGEKVPDITPPDGYKITVFATGLAAPRSIVAYPDGDVVFVAERGAGRIIALQDADGDLIAEDPLVIADKLTAPTGLDFYNGWLYVAQADRVTRIQIDEDFNVLQQDDIITDLPVGRNNKEIESNQHALLVYNNELYLSIGANCPACEEDDSRHATVMVYDLDGSNERIFTRGLYQVLGMAVNPINGELWVTNQGRPQLPHDAPETIYKIENGDNAGWAGCIAGDIIAPEMKDENACEGVIQPLLKLEAQSNITGLMFYNDPDAPEEYRGDALVILNGGVTHDEAQVGMSILRIDIDPETGMPLDTESTEFISGFWLSEEPGDYLGRPYDLTMTNNGTIYITDDASSAVYELRFDETR